MRAMTNRTSFGRELIAGQWAAAEFDALSRLWHIGQDSGSDRGAVPGAGQRDRADARVHRRPRDRARPRPRLAQARPDADDPRRPVAADWSTRSRCWPAPGWPTATCRRTTCWSTRGGWCSSTCRRSSTWSPTRRAASSWPVTCEGGRHLVRRAWDAAAEGGRRRAHPRTARRGGTAVRSGSRRPVVAMTGRATLLQVALDLVDGAGLLGLGVVTQIPGGPAAS